jgi:beta-mannosidase
MFIDLNGSWNVSRANLKKPVPAQVPGCIHTDLLDAGIIEDPFFRDNETALQWVGESDWTYSRRFQITSSFLKHDRIVLRCLGIDTLAGIYVNGRIAGNCDNMFRTWEFDIKPLLRTGANRIEIRFLSTLPLISRRYSERPLPGWLMVPGSSYVRKEPCSYGWDWGPKLITCGIWRDIMIEAFNIARINSVSIIQEHNSKKNVRLNLTVEIERTAGTPLLCEVKVSYGTSIICEKKISVRGNVAKTTMDISDPKLWWPAGMGEQPLYTVTTVILDNSGQILDSSTKKTGLRTIRVIQKDDEWGRSFYFSVNGTRFFAKGANWIPADTFITRLKPENYRKLITDAKAVGMNMLRAWGGGIYEQDCFYDICDELGICVWQDFIFSCSSVPSFDHTWMGNVRHEIRQNVLRLRHHACIALWCGNNEIEQGILGPSWDESHMGMDDYKLLFDTLIPGILNELDPTRDYWPASPHTPVGNRIDGNDLTCGDAHLWGVWHGQHKFSEYRKWFPRFASEFGFQSFPHPRTVSAYTAPQDRNITSFVMEHHQRSGIGNSTIMHYMLDWFRIPRSFEMTIWVSQILQALGIKIAVEHWRRAMPRCMGTLYWQINDCWPVASWSSIDSYGRWKALHYAAARFYAPILVSAIEKENTSIVEFFVTSDLAMAQYALFTWTLTDLNGKKIARGRQEIIVRTQSSRKFLEIDLSDKLESTGRRNAVLWFQLKAGNKFLSENTLLFAPPKHLDLMDPGIKTSVKSTKNHEFEIRITCEKPALWVWLEHSNHDIHFHNNFFDMCPGTPVSITAKPGNGKLSEDEFIKGLMAYSIKDTYEA